MWLLNIFIGVLFVVSFEQGTFLSFKPMFMEKGYSFSCQNLNTPQWITFNPYETRGSHFSPCWLMFHQKTPFFMEKLVYSIEKNEVRKEKREKKLSKPFDTISSKNKSILKCSSMYTSRPFFRAFHVIFTSFHL